MSNDLNFLNTYVQVVDENISSVIKQNFVFQTQLKIAEIKLAQLEDAKQTVDKLTVENKELHQKINDLTNLTSSYRTVSDDKSRLQISLNETSQVKNQLQSDLNSALQEIDRLKNKIKQLTKPEESKVAVAVMDKGEKKTTKPLKASSGTF